MDRERKKKDRGGVRIQVREKSEDYQFFFAAFPSLHKFDEAPAEPRVSSVEALIFIYTTAPISGSTEKLAPAALS